MLLKKIMHQEDKKIILTIFGKNGQVGSQLIKQIKDIKNFEFNSYSRKEAEFLNPQQLKKFLYNNALQSNFIINAVAYTNVDKAEDEKEICDATNNKAAKILAEFCNDNSITLIQYSTDYIFDGSGDQPFTTDNTKNLKPLNYYGETKLKAERSIIQSGCNYLILRTSWVYSNDSDAKNFVNTIKRLAQQKTELKIVDDQIGSPTSATFIASKTIALINKSIAENNFQMKQILHVVEPRYISWYDFACEIIEKLRVNNQKLLVKKIIPIKTKDFETKATRPLNSRLKFSKLP